MFSVIANKKRSQGQPCNGMWVGVKKQKTFVPRVTSQTIVLECIFETMLETGLGGNCFLTFGTILEKQIVEFNSFKARVVCRICIFSAIY